MNRMVMIAAVAGLLSACAPTMTTTSLVTSAGAQWQNENLSAVLPVGWGKFRPPHSLLGVTKDGALLQSIVIAKWKDSKGLPATERNFSSDMLLSEVSELVIDELSFDPQLKNFSVETNEPVDVNGAEAFRVAYRFTNDRGVPYRAIVYGLRMQEKIYLVTYSAMSQHHYAENLSVFEDFIRGLRLDKGDSAL